MKDLFCKVLREFLFVFFDDILVYSPNKEQNYNHLKHILQTLSQHQIHAKKSPNVHSEFLPLTIWVVLFLLKESLPIQKKSQPFKLGLPLLTSKHYVDFLDLRVITDVL